MEYHVEIRGIRPNTASIPFSAGAWQKARPGEPVLEKIKWLCQYLSSSRSGLGAGEQRRFHGRAVSVGNLQVGSHLCTIPCPSKPLDYHSPPNGG